MAQHAKTAEHAFQVQLTRYDGLHAPQAIKVIDRKSGALIQEIADTSGIETARSPARFIRLVDANADGHPDIALFVNNGGSGANSVENFYLFDPTSGRYAFHEGLSGLSQVKVDRKGTITASLGGCCSQSSQSYRFIGGKMTLLASREEWRSADGKSLRIKTGTDRGGTMRYRTRSQPLPPGY